jgi:diamine N-acetyltransferase
MNIRVTRVTAEDLDSLLEISRTTFRETFAESNSPDDMQKYLDENLNRDTLRDQLTHPDSEFYFAVIDESPVGYMKLNFGAAQTELKDVNAVEIERIYALKEFHGKQVGQTLYHKAVDIAKSGKLQYLWLGVWEKNQRAIAFYRKNGFVEFGKHVFMLGNDKQTDLMMKLVLV